MSSRIEPFECRWRVSPILLAASLALWALALLSILLAALPVWLKPPLALVCLAYGAWGLYRQVLLRGSRAFRGLRHDERGWQLWSAGSGWQAAAGWFGFLVRAPEIMPASGADIPSALGTPKLRDGEPHAGQSSQTSIQVAYTCVSGARLSDLHDIHGGPTLWHTPNVSLHRC